MKVLLVNGSPNKNGCTYTALSEVAKALDECGVNADFFHIGKKPIPGCIACYKCGELKNVYLTMLLMSLLPLQVSMTALSSAPLCISRALTAV